MKKLLLSFALSLILNTLSFGSHLMGGQITATHISGLNYHIVMTIYRDVIGIPIQPMDEIYVYDLIQGHLIGSVSIAASPAINIGNGVEEYVYDTTFVFPGNGDYILTWQNCCRNLAILNLDPAGMYLQNQLHVDGGNSSPIFINPPIPIAQVNNPFYYNPLPYDADGDSLHWQLDLPYDNSLMFADPFNSHVISGYSLPPSDTTMPFTMNTITGEISFLPNTEGHFVVSVLASEYRNGVKIGEIRRDMQIIVIPSANSPASFSRTCNILPESDASYRIAAGSMLDFNMTATDFADNDYLSFDATGGIFFSNNSPDFIHHDDNGSADCRLTWTPDVSQINSQPYILVVRSKETHPPFVFNRDFSLALYVDAAKISDDVAPVYNMSIHTITQNFIDLSLTLSGSGAVSINVVNMLGQHVKELFNGELKNGNHQLAFNNMILRSGIYFLTINTTEAGYKMQKIFMP